MKMKTKLTAILVSFVLVGCGGGAQDSSTLDAQSKQVVRSAKAVGTTPADYEVVTQALYVAYFGRPADPTGLANYEAALLAASAPTDINGLANSYATNSTVKALVDSFGTSSESQALYGSGTADQFVSAIFQNVLGRAPASAYWTGLVSAGTISQGEAALAIMAGAETNQTAQGLLDAQLVNNRLTVAEAFTATVTSMSAVKAYTGAGAAANARVMLSGVTAATVTSNYQTQVSASVQYSIETQTAIDTFNAARTSAGLAALNKVGSLAIAAQNHVNYMALNSTAAAEEIAGNPGYTFGDTSSRLVAAGYGSPDGTDEDGGTFAPHGANSLVGTGAAVANNWLACPVLRNAFMSTSVFDVGIGLALAQGKYSGNVSNDTLLGWKEPLPNISPTFVAVYPAASSTNVALVSGYDTFAFPSYTVADFQAKTSYPISVSVPTTVTINAGSISVTAAGSSTPLPMTTFSAANNTELEGWYFAFVGTAPFAPNTTYNVTFTGTTTAGTINKSWSFTTGAGTTP